jgi:hypothetical protein
VEVALGESSGKAPRRPSSPRPRRRARQGWKPNGRDAALQAAWGTAREPGPEGGDIRCFKAWRPYTFCTYWTNGTTRGISDLVNDEVIP